MERVSVVITCHPPLEKYLEEAVRSVQAQTVKPFEIIIVLDNYDKPMIFRGVTTIVSDEVRGVAKSRNGALKLAQGDYVLFLDADDSIPENFLEEMLKVKADIIYPDILLWCYWSEKPLPNVMHYTPKRITEEILLKQNQVVITSLIKKDIFDVVGNFDPSLPIFEDYDFFLRAIKSGFTFKKANTFMKYRQRQNSRNHQNDELKTKTYQEITAKYA